MLFRETVYCENHTEHTDTFCGKNLEFWYVKAGGTYGKQFVPHKKHIMTPQRSPTV
jgi:hypothetical protein